MLRIYIIGISILIIAILANGMAYKIGMASWYDFLKLINEHGWKAFSHLNVLDYLWLFIGYPLTLGFGYYIGEKAFQLMF